MIKDSQKFLIEAEKVNEWWISGQIKLSPLLEREVFTHSLNELKNRRVIQILGPRRVGKTTLIKQIISHLLSEKVNPRNILYLSLDDPIFGNLSNNLLEDVVDFFLENIALGEKKYVFLDEIHAFEGWYKWIKSYYDRYNEKIKFIISGSSSLSLQKEANLYLRGRTVDIQLFPFSFSEFLEFNGLKIEKFTLEKCFKLHPLKVEALGKKVKKHFNEYLLVGGFPEWFETKNVREWFEKIINDIPKKAVYEDVTNIFNIRNPKILENIFAFLVENQSQIISYEKINEIAGLQRSILLNYIEYLKNSYLIIEIQKFTPGIKERIKSKKKFLVLDQGIRNALLKEYEINLNNIGFIVENIIGIHLHRYYPDKVYYFKTNGEIDFVVQKNRTDILPIEAKFRERIPRPKGLLDFIESKNLKTGLVISKNHYGQELNGKLFFIPAWLFLLVELEN